MPLLSLSGERPSNLGVHDGELAACPNSPNCVSSDATGRVHRIEALHLEASPQQAWSAARSAVEAIARTRVITATDDYLHAECTSALMGYVDDLELHLRPEADLIAVRSASRLGYGDMGVNRRRVEDLRKQLRKTGTIGS